MVDPGGVAGRPVGQDGPEAALYEMTVSARVDVVTVAPGLVAAPEVVSHLVAKCEVAEGAGLPGQGHREAGGQGGLEGGPAALRVEDQEVGRVRRLPQSRYGTLGWDTQIKVRVNVLCLAVINLHLQ